jgi:hypothetical protein
LQNSVSQDHVTGWSLIGDLGKALVTEVKRLEMQSKISMRKKYRPYLNLPGMSIDNQRRNFVDSRTSGKLAFLFASSRDINTRPE